jgi:hypothetical protein
MNTHNLLEAYRKGMVEKFKKLLAIIEKSDAVKTASVDDSGEVHIEFVEPVDIEGQNIINVFVRGGAIKKTASKDNIDDQYFEIPAIGDF